MLTILELEMFIWIAFGFNDAHSAPVVPLINARIKYTESQGWCLA